MEWVTGCARMAGDPEAAADQTEAHPGIHRGDGCRAGRHWPLSVSPAQLSVRPHDCARSALAQRRRQRARSTGRHRAQGRHSHRTWRCGRPPRSDSRHVRPHLRCHSRPSATTAAQRRGHSPPKNWRKLLRPHTGIRPGTAARHPCARAGSQPDRGGRRLARGPQPSPWQPGGTPSTRWTARLTARRPHRLRPRDCGAASSRIDARACRGDLDRRPGQAPSAEPGPGRSPA